MVSPIRLASSRNETFSDGVPSIRMLAPGESWNSPLVILFFDDFAGADPTGESFSDDALTLALSKITTKGTIIFGAGTYKFQNQFTIRKNVTFKGQGSESTYLEYYPSASNNIFITFTGVSANVACLNEEGQLNGCTIEGISFRSDLTTRANCLKIIKVDKLNIYDVRIYGFPGFALNCQRSREWSIINFESRYNGYLDPTNNANSVSSIIWASAEASGDSTNYTKNSNIFLVYSFGDLIKVEDCPDMDVSNLMLHQLAEANVALESNIVNAFPVYNGQPSQPGYGASGEPLNPYAALHVSPGGPAANVAGRKWASPFLSTMGTYVKNSDLRISGGELVGGLTNYGIWADTSSRLDLNNFRVDSTSAQQQGSTSIYSSTFTISSNTLTLTATVPETGTACQITNSGGSLPTGITRKTTYYIIKLSSTTCRLASSRANALAGTNISISGGSGTQTLTTLAGYNILATGGATVTLGHVGGVRLNEGYQPMFSDISSYIYGSPLIGSTYSNGFAAPQLGTEQVLFVLKDVDMTSTADQQFIRVCACSRYYVTRVVAKGLGGNAGVAAGGIYTAAAKGGSTIVAAGQAWSGVSDINKIQIATLAAYASSDAPTATPYWSLTTGAGSAARADIYIYGFPID